MRGGRGVGAELVGVERGAVALLRAEGRARRFRTGATLFHEGDDSDWIGLVVKGRVKVSCYGADGRERLVAVIGPGELLGELSAIDGEPRSATATALEPLDAHVLTSDEFVALLEKHPSATLGILRSVIGRLRDSDKRRVEFGALDTVGRVARLIVELAERYGEEADGVIRIHLPLSQEELAGWAGASREAVVKALRQLRSRGWIETGRREIRVLDLPAIERRSA
ncbi:MAG TPA: Crp/Fnr family transcriptional regulator [Acidimicrobiales bacterium]|nr:Crp/Fnr family transcriptional regulator [Acidimicrobiales bacterium]